MSEVTHEQVPGVIEDPSILRKFLWKILPFTNRIVERNRLLYDSSYEQVVRQSGKTATSLSRDVIHVPSTVVSPLAFSDRNITIAKPNALNIGSNFDENHGHKTAS